MAMWDGEEIYWDLAHDFHCFDGLRQYIMCNADDTMLNTTGHQDAGHHQTLQCKDWDAIRSFAEEYGTCYRDAEAGKGLQTLGFCEQGDGLL
jgi:hypothetical protein